MILYRSGYALYNHGRVQSGGGDRGTGPPPPEKSQNIGFPSNTDPDPLKSQSYQASSLRWFGVVICGLGWFICGFGLT